MDIEKEEKFHITFTKEEAISLTRALQVALKTMDTEKNRVLDS